MADLGDLETVERLLEGLANRSTPLVVQLPRQPGKREARYAHLLAGEVDMAQESASESPLALGAAPASARERGLAERVAVLEAQMAEVLAKLEGL
jgi:uncharacterized protein YceH (UPF0502 family)